MSGLLADTMAAELRSGVYRVSHTYFLKVPEDAAKTDYESTLIHDMVSNVVRVTDNGVMDRSGYNYSVSEPGALSFGEYRFKASNVDGYFSRGADLWEHSTTSYIAEPHECLVQRWSSIFVGAAWSLIPGTLYTGQVDRVEYTRATMSTPKDITFFCGPQDLDTLTGKSWGEDDYDELDLSSTFTGPAPEDN